MIQRRLKRAALAAIPALVGLAALPESALAQCCTTPTPCCAPPSPPERPSQPCCGSGGHNVNVPGVTVNVGASVIVNASASAVVNASASGSAGGVIVVGGGGGGGGGFVPGPVTTITGLNVEGARRERYEASRTRIRTIVIRAVCIDDRNVPHPASQVTPDRDIAEGYDGELYRCLAGSRLQATWSDWAGKADFDSGESMMCAKGEALYYQGGAAADEAGGRAGKMECRPQRAARECNERSLLRRYGAGVKVIKVITTETYTASREESVETRSFSMSLDGGVGGVAY